MHEHYPTRWPVTPEDLMQDAKRSRSQYAVVALGTGSTVSVSDAVSATFTRSPGMNAVYSHGYRTA